MIEHGGHGTSLLNVALQLVDVGITRTGHKLHQIAACLPHALVSIDQHA